MSSDSSDTSVNTGYSDSSDCDSQDTVDELSQSQVDYQICDPYRSDITCLSWWNLKNIEKYEA